MVKKSFTTKVMKKITPKVSPIGSIGTESLVLPNHSGDNVKGFVSKTPVDDVDIANKKYVDDQAGSPERLVAHVKEANVSAVKKGQMCAIVGSSGSKFEVQLCDCDDKDLIRVIGLAQTDTAQNAAGTVIYKGTLEEVDTRPTNTDVNPNGETWLAGDLLFVSRTPGGLTKVRPTSGRCIKAGRTLKGSSVSDTLLAIVHTNAICSCAASGEDMCSRMGDSAGVNKYSFKDYANNEVGAMDSNGNFTLSGTVDGVDIAGRDHAESHTIASHSDTTATGTELNTLTDNSVANTLHRHSELVASDGSPDPAVSVDADGNVGIGTETPSVKMHVVGGDGNQLWLDNGGERWCEFDFKNNGAGRGYLAYDNNNSNFIAKNTVSGGDFYITTTGTGKTVIDNGNLWIAGDCSALSFTDRTPYPKNLKEAQNAIDSVEGKEGKLNKKKLHPILKSGEDGRDLSMTVSVLLEVVKDLKDRIEILEKG